MILMNSLGLVMFAKLALFLFSTVLLSTYAYAANDNEVDECQSALSKENYDVAFQRCEYEAEKGDALAAEIMGFLYLKGLGTTRDWALARKYLEQSIDAGNLNASRYLAILYWNGLGVEKSNEKAREYFKDCLVIAKDKNIDCAVQYAKVLGYNSNPPAIKEEAIDVYNKLIDVEHYEFSYDLASISLNVGKYKQSYKYAEFFIFWVRRYGDIALYSKSVQDSERIKEEARRHLTDADIGECYNWVKDEIYKISQKFNK